MRVPLYKHQAEAVDILRSGSILCGGVGTGKSRTALAYYYTHICGGKLVDGVSRSQEVPLYIITTARKRDTFEWARECAIFGLSSEIRDTKGRDVVVDSWNNIKKYVDVTGAFFIFDEQRVVGKGAWVKAFLKITKSNQWILLTATPGDTWIDYVPVFIANGYYKNRTQFERRHVVYAPMSKFPKIVRYLHEDELEHIRNKIVVYMDYSREAIQHDEWVTTLYSKPEYEKVYKDRWDIENNEPIKNLSRYCYLQRKVANQSDDKLFALLAVLEEHPRAIIFYSFDYELEMLRKLCDDEGIEFSEWNGHRHEPLPTGGKWLYLVNYSAGAEGWNCTQTDTIIFFSLTYSYKTLHQARGRIDRLNSPYTDLYYFYLVSNAEIDQRIRYVLKNKKNFNERDFASDLGFSFA